MDEGSVCCQHGLAEAFDRVNLTKWMQILIWTGIDWCGRRFISKLYMDQSVKLGLYQRETRNVKTGRGVTQGCCLSPILSKFYS
jgi:hypothetical protein